MIGDDKDITPEEPWEAFEDEEFPEEDLEGIELDG